MYQSHKEVISFYRFWRWYHINHIFKISSASSNYSCSGSETWCEYIKDINDSLSPRLLKEALWPTDHGTNPMIDGMGYRRNSTLFKMAQTFFNNTIIVRLRYKSSKIEFTKLDVRTTATDKIANFGGTFGIWAELTGCSLLGMINLLIISFKLLFRSRNWMNSLLLTFFSHWMDKTEIQF